MNCHLLASFKDQGTRNSDRVKQIGSSEVHHRRHVGCSYFIVNTGLCTVNQPEGFCSN